jgi:type IV pilus assembly protein PilB
MKRLGDIVIERGWMTQEQLDSALKEYPISGMKLGSYLLYRNYLTRNQLGEVLSEQYEVPFQPLDTDAIHPQLVRLLPEAFARRRKLVPAAVEGNRLTLAMIWPGDMDAISETELMTGYEITSAICLEDEAQEIWDRAYDKRHCARQTAIDIRLEELENEVASELDEVDSGESESPVVRLVQSILMGAVHAGASDIHIEPFEPRMRVRYRIDGDMQKVMTIPTDTESALVGRIKVLANLNTAESRRPQDGNITIEDGGKRASYRVSIIPVVGGEKIVMRVLDESTRVFSLDSIGMPAGQIERVKQLLDRPHGMIVMTGPTGSGKTTTMYSMLCSIDSAARNISTIEDPVEYRLPGINQVHANNDFGLGFANGLKYLMRQDPDVILVGEIRDRETASTAVQAALTGHLLISTLHTNDAIGTVTRLNDLGLDNFKIAGSLVAAMAQRLLRRLCPECRRPTKLNRRLIELMFEGREIPAHLDIDADYFAPGGCDACSGSGYAGRLPIYEIFTVTPGIEAAIESGMPSSRLRELAAAEGMVELAVEGLNQARLGLTSVEEVYYKLTS